MHQLRFEGPPLEHAHQRGGTKSGQARHGKTVQVRWKSPIRTSNRISRVKFYFIVMKQNRFLGREQNGGEISVKTGKWKTLYSKMRLLKTNFQPCIVIAQNSIWVISITRTHYKSIIRIGWYNFGFRTAEIIAQLLLFLLIVIAIKSESVSNKRFLVFQVSYPRPFFEVIRPENVETFDEATQWLKIT